MSCGNCARFAHTGRSSHSPRTSPLDSNVISRTFRADRNALSQNQTVSVTFCKLHVGRGRHPSFGISGLTGISCTASRRLFGRFSRHLFRIYSDASHTEGVRTRLGWVLMTDKATTPVGYWYDIPASLLRDWALAHPIMAAEAFAVLTAIWQHRDFLTGRDVISFMGSEAAARAMIKSDSRLPVAGAMAMCVQLLLDPLQHRGVVRVGRLLFKPCRRP